MAVEAITSVLSFFRGRVLDYFRFSKGVYAVRLIRMVAGDRFRATYDSGVFITVVVVISNGGPGPRREGGIFGVLTKVGVISHGS